MSLTVSSFFHYFMFNPCELPKKQSRMVALVSSVAIGVFTLGLTHLICYIAFYQRRFTSVSMENASQEVHKTQEVVAREIRADVVTSKRKRRTKKGLKKFSAKQLPQTVNYQGRGGVRFDQMKQEALEGNVDYQLFIGKLFLLGKSGFPRSNSNAFFWYSKAAENEAPLGLYRAGKMYYKGFGVKKDKDAGLELLRKAAEAGNRSAGSYLRKIEEKRWP